MIFLNDIILDMEKYNFDETPKMIISIIGHYLKINKSVLSNQQMISFYKKIFNDNNIIDTFKKNNKIFFPIQFEKLNKKETADYIYKITLYFTNDENYSQYVKKAFLDYDYIESYQSYMDQYIEDEFKNIIGMDNIKDDLHDMVTLIVNNKMREKQGLNKVTTTMHMVFLGNPGTGKTTIARIVGKIYNSLDIIPNETMLEVTRQDLVAEYVGQTAVKTQKVLEKAKGGILFIDEAYTLTSNSDNDYGQESIDTILKFMEDNRSDTVLIVAGYEDLMKKFIKSNPGLESRFNKFLHFKNYTSDELFKIFTVFINKDNFIISKNEREKIQEKFKEIDTNQKNFSNARYVRNLYDKTMTNQMKRVKKQGITSGEKFITILSEDVEI